MQDSDVSGGLLDPSEVYLLAELDHWLFQIYHLVLGVVDKLETQEVGVHKLVLADVFVHQAELLVIFVLESVRECSDVSDFIHFGDQVQQDEQLALDEAQPFEVVFGVAVYGISNDVYSHEVLVSLSEESIPLEEFGPA